MSQWPEKQFNPEHYFQQQEIVELTAAQLIKDFSDFAFTLRFTGAGESPYAELSEQVCPIVEKLWKERPSLLQSLLYRIDISEKEIQRGRALYPDSSFPALLTDLILRREMKKVLYRKFYR